MMFQCDGCALFFGEDETGIMVQETYYFHPKCYVEWRDSHKGLS